jgi:hypothetical protein
LGEQRCKRIPFDEPLAVWLFNGRPDMGMRLIRDVHDALAALHRYGLETMKNDGQPCREWRLARSALLRALQDRSPAAVSEARSAIVRAAESVGALAATNRVEILLIREDDPFAP